MDCVVQPERYVSEDVTRAAGLAVEVKKGAGDADLDRSCRRWRERLLERLFDRSVLEMAPKKLRSAGEEGEEGWLV